MSTLIMSACWGLQMPPTPKAVLISLADNANDHGECWPSIQTICVRTCFGKTAVIAAIQWLEEAGLVSANRDNGRHTTYTITPAKYQNPSASRTGPSAEPVRLPDGTCPPPEPNRSASRSIPVRQADTNRQEPSRTVKSNRQGKSLAAAIELLPGLPAELVADFVAVRQAKKLPLTGTAVAGLEREAGKAGLSLESAIRLCCERGWAALRADWLARDGGQGMQASAQIGAVGDIRELL